MASSSPQGLDSAASSEESSEVQVLDSVEPLVTASSSEILRSVQVFDSCEPLVPTPSRVQVLDSVEPLATAASSEVLRSVQVIDSSEPLVPTPSRVQVLDSVEPLATAASSDVLRSVQVIDSSEPLVPTPSRVQVLDSGEPLVFVPTVEADAGPSGMAGPSGLAGPSGIAGPSGMAGPSGLAGLSGIAGPSGMAGPSGLAGPSGIAGPSGMAGPSGLAGPSGMAGSRGIADPRIGSSSDESSNEAEISNTPQTGSSGRRVNYYADELRSMWTWRRIYQKLGTAEQCVQFAEERGLIKREMNCSHHRRPMSLSMASSQLGIFRCRKGNCRNRSISRAVGTWFENVKLNIVLVFHIMFAFCEKSTYHTTRKELSRDDEPVLSEKTIADWFSYCREAIVVYELEHQNNENKIGGPNKIVQIDESKFGRRKYNRGRHIEGHWVLGMIENGSDDLRLEVCPDNVRTAEILVPLIQKHVQVGSIIHTDYWRAYMSLPEYGYVHRRVNHSDINNRFVAPDGTHTQRIESQWRGLKKAFRQEHHKSDFSDWLCEYSWRRKIRINHLDPFEELIRAILYVYNNT